VNASGSLEDVSGKALESCEDERRDRRLVPDHRHGRIERVHFQRLEDRSHVARGERGRWHRLDGAPRRGRRWPRSGARGRSGLVRSTSGRTSRASPRAAARKPRSPSAVSGPFRIQHAGTLLRCVRMADHEDAAWAPQL
jgi:hypothetical protein